MARRVETILSRLFGDGRARRGWRRVAAEPPDLSEPADLRRARIEARQERREIDRFLADVEKRLSADLGATNAMRKPAGGDWSWRPALWRVQTIAGGVATPATGEVLDEETSLFHDCSLNEISLRQDRNRRPTDLAAFGVVIETFEFCGSFLSLAIKLPDDGVHSLRQHHILQVCADVEAEHPVAMSARLNVRHGPNTAEIPASLPDRAGERVAEFELAHWGINDSRIERAWLDIILIAPRMNRVRMNDIVVTRRPRAEC